MSKIIVHARNKSGAMPWVFKPMTDEEAADLGPIELTRREVEDLVAAGVWAPEFTKEWQHNWVRYGEGGEVWAGCQDGPGAPVGKVRGKKGRRIGGRSTWKTDDEKYKTVSVNMLPATRQRLEAIAAQRSEAEGRRVTVSNIINELVGKFLEEQP